MGMRKLYVLSLLCSGLVCGQVTHNVVLQNLTNLQGMQESLTVLRTVADISTVSLDAPKSTISVSGTDEQVALAEWILKAVDSKTPMAEQQYQMANGDTVKVVFLAHTNTNQGMQEMLTQLRTMLDMQRIFDVSEPKAIVFRGKAPLIESGSWLISQLDKSYDSGATPVTYQDVKVYYMHNIVDPKPTQELLTAVRMNVRVNKAFYSYSPHALVIRGNESQIGAVDQIVAQRDVR